MGDLCTACLCTGRNLYFIGETGFYHLYSQILNEIPIYDLSQVCVRVCWECRALLRRFHLFKLQVKRSYTELMHHAHENITMQKSLAKPSHLTIQQQFDLNNISCQHDEIKTEIIEPNNDIYEVKSETGDAETHCEPETFVNDLKLERPKRKKDAAVKKDKPKKEKLTKKLKAKPIKEKTKKKTKVKKRQKRVTSSDESVKDVSDGVSDLESVVDECKGENGTIDETKDEKLVKVKLKHTENEVKKDVAERSEKAPKKLNGSSVAVGERPQCVECGKIFSSRKTYRYHLNVLHKGQNRYPCPRCGKVYQWKSNLGRHMRSHKARDSGELYCETCDKRFASVATYRQHLRVSRRHVSESEFTFMCNECGKKFVNKTRLRDHIDWEHLKKIKFRCQLCNKPFKCHTSLYVHMQNVHRNKEKKDNLCHVCGKSYQNAAKLKYHIVAMHTSETPYACAQCGAAFGWYSSLYRHVREVHYKMKVQPKKTKKSKKLTNEVLPTLLPPPHVLQTLHQPGPP